MTRRTLDVASKLWERQSAFDFDLSGAFPADRLSDPEGPSVLGGDGETTLFLREMRTRMVEPRGPFERVDHDLDAVEDWQIEHEVPIPETGDGFQALDIVWFETGEAEFHDAVTAEVVLPSRVGRAWARVAARLRSFFLQAEPA